MSSRIPLLFLCVPALAAAQSTAPAPASEPVKLEQFVITASPFARDAADLAQATSVLAGQALSLRQQPTLGETLAGLPGVNSTYFGPGASRPVVRGLGGDRIRVLENGAGTIDASAVSPDHAVSVEPFLIERVEVVRGPASLLYGAAAVGGVVNILTHRIETAAPERAVDGLFEFRLGTHQGERAQGGVVDLAAEAGAGRFVVLHLDGFERKIDAIDIPGFAESAEEREHETEEAIDAGEPVPVFARDRLPNSALDSRGGSAGLSLVAKSGHLGFSYSGFDSLYGVPGHAHAGAGVQIDLRQRRFDLQGEISRDFGPFNRARLKVGRASYEHVELEDGAVATTFRNKGHDARLEMFHGHESGLGGALGLQVDVRDGSGRARDDGAFTVSGGSVWNPSAGWTLAASLTRTERAPNPQELFSDGPHAGTGAYEIGDAGLGREKSLGFELNLRKRAGRVTGEVSLFANRFDGFIFERPTGLVAVERPAGLEFVDPDTLTHAEEEEALPVFRFTATDADFWGAEAEVIVHLHDAAQHRLDLRLAADFTRAEDGAGRPLPRIPALRYSLGLAWENGPWSAGADMQITDDQGRVAANESATDGYALVSAHAAWRAGAGRWRWEVFVRGTNLTDEEARPHTSFLKDLAPLPGRHFTAGVRLAF
jgi:iron complex outermembrane receptor protein